MDRKIDKKKWPPKKIAWVSVASLFVLVVIYNIGFGDHSSKLNVEKEKITISTVDRGPFQEFIPVTGAVMPIKTVYLDAIEGGKVDTVEKLAGSFVSQGDMILRLENTQLLIQISNQDAMVVEQHNLLTNTRFNLDQNRTRSRQLLIDREYETRRLKRIFERQKKLYEGNLISKEEFEQSKDDYDYELRLQQLNTEAFKRDSIFQEVQLNQAENSLNRLGNNLRIAQKRLDNLIISAPVTGQLTSLNAEIGESKAPGERLGQIDVLDGFKVRAAIDEHYIARIEVGQLGQFDFAGKTYTLVTKKVFPEVQNGRFEVDMEFEGEEPGDIRRGQTVRIRLELGDLTEAVMLARGGFYQKTGGNWVYVVEPAGDLATKRQIRLGRQNTQVFEVLEGLEPGERVVTSSYDNYGDIDKLVLKE
jgi:HlyD family secretion protein